MGQVVNLPPIGNRRALSEGIPHLTNGSTFAACRYVGQVVNLPPIGNRRAAGDGNGAQALGGGFSTLSYIDLSL